MVAVVIALTTVFSDAEFFVRLSSVIGALLSSLILYKLSKELYGNKMAGFHTVWIANLTPVFSAGAIIVTPDTPLIPFYIAGLLGFLIATKSRPEDTRDSYIKWAVAGALIGGALLSKYTAFFFYPCALLYLTLSAEKRFWLTKPHPYIAALTSFIAFTPVLLWNAQNNWASLSFQAGHGLSKTGGNPLAMFAEFIGLQVILYSIGIFFFLLAAFVALTKKSFFKSTDAKTKEAVLFLFSFSAPILLFFVLNSFRARMEGNWPVLGFIPLFVQAGVMVALWRQGKVVGKAWTASAVLAVLLFAFLHIQIVNPIIPHPQRYEISRRVYGWELLGQHIDKARSENSAAFMIANRHQFTGLMNYYTSPHLPAYLIDQNAKRYFYLPEPDSFKGKNAVYLAEAGRDEISRIKPMFEQVEKAETVEIIRKNELIRKFSIYRCYNYLGGLK